MELSKEPLHDQEVFVSHATHSNAALTPRARLRLARLIAEHGPDAALRTLRDELAGTCPRRTAAMSRRCNVYFPQVVGLFRRGG